MILYDSPFPVSFSGPRSIHPRFFTSAQDILHGDDGDTGDRHHCQPNDIPVQFSERNCLSKIPGQPYPVPGCSIFRIPPLDGITQYDYDMEL